MIRGASGGYTILELMIVLAVSLIILVSAAMTIHGTSGKTQFAQSMRDINSKLNSWISSVTNGFPGGSNTAYKCTLDTSNRPQIDTDNSGRGSTNPVCVYVGKVIHFTTQSSCSNCDPNSIYAYSVFGRRVRDAAGDLTDNIPDANPVPAVGSANPSARSGTGSLAADLTEKYSLPGGTTVKSITATLSNGSASTRLLGISQSFNANPSPTNGSQNLYVYSSMVANNPPGNSQWGGPVTDCIELLSVGCAVGTNNPNAWPPAVITWKACFASGYNSQTAQITLSSANGLSAQTKLDFVAC